MSKDRENKGFSLPNLFKSRSTKPAVAPDAVDNNEKQEAISMAEGMRLSLNKKYEDFKPTLQKLTDAEKKEFERSASGMSGQVTTAIDKLRDSKTPSELKANKELLQTKVSKIDELFEKTKEYVDGKKASARPRS